MESPFNSVTSVYKEGTGHYSDSNIDVWSVPCLTVLMSELIIVLFTDVTWMSLGLQGKYNCLTMAVQWTYRQRHG